MRHKLRNNNHITNATKTSFTSVKCAIFIHKNKKKKGRLITMKKVIIKLNNITIGESEMTFSEITEAESAGFTIIPK